MPSPLRITNTRVRRSRVRFHEQKWVRFPERRGVGAEALYRHFHVSRSTVYRLFEPVGGVRQFINGARLERWYGELRKT